MASLPDTNGPAIRRLGLYASLIWAGLVLAYGFGYISTLRPGGGELAIVLVGLGLAAIVPVLMIRAIVRLSISMGTGNRQQDVALGKIAALEREIAALNQRLRAAEASLKARPAAPPPQDPAPEPAPVADPQPVDPVQQDLPLEGGFDGAELTLQETIRALNFPQNADDRAGFQVLRRALATRDLARLLQASEDCLNLLAHEGIYMDDLIPAPATADDWRQFARGGVDRAELMPLTGITDARALETVRTKMRADPIFRDTALHFQRRFDQILQDIAADASDNDVLQLVDTRSGRAFVLLVQVGGMSDPARRQD